MHTAKHLVSRTSDVLGKQRTVDPRNTTSAPRDRTQPTAVRSRRDSPLPVEDDADDSTTGRPEDPTSAPTDLRLEKEVSADPRATWQHQDTPLLGNDASVTSTPQEQTETTSNDTRSPNQD